MGVERGNAPHAHRGDCIGAVATRHVLASLPRRPTTHTPPAPLRRVRAWLVWGELPPASGAKPLLGTHQPSQPAGTRRTAGGDLTCVRRSRRSTSRAHWMWAMHSSAHGRASDNAASESRQGLLPAHDSELPNRRRLTGRLAARGYWSVARASPAISITWSRAPDPSHSTVSVSFGRPPSPSENG